MNLAMMTKFANSSTNGTTELNTIRAMSTILLSSIEERESGYVVIKASAEAKATEVSAR